MNIADLKDPLELGRRLWPGSALYDKQREVFRSVWEDDETYVPACNKGGV